MYKKLLLSLALLPFIARSQAIYSYQDWRDGGKFGARITLPHDSTTQAAKTPKTDIFFSAGAIWGLGVDGYYHNLTGGSAPLTTIPWDSVTNTPTTLNDYGITDGVTNVGSYLDPSWIIGLSGIKVTGFFADSNTVGFHTPGYYWALFGAAGTVHTSAPITGNGSAGTPVGLSGWSSPGPLKFYGYDASSVLGLQTLGTAAFIDKPVSGNATGGQAVIATDTRLSDARNANALQGKAIAATTPTNGQALIYNSTSGQYEPATPAGGSQTLPQVLATGRTLSANDSILIAAAKNLHFNGIIQTDTQRSAVIDTVKLGNVWTITGTSVVQGSGASQPAKDWASLVAKALNVTLNNQGYGGFTASNPPGTSAPSFLTVLHNPGVIPHRDATHTMVVNAWGENDSWYGFQYCCNILDYSNLRFGIAMDTILNYEIAQGYDSTCIINVNPTWQLTTRTSKVFQDSAYNKVKSISAARHMLFVDGYASEQFSAPGDKADDVHPSDWGHANKAAFFLKALDSVNTVKHNNQSLAINGPVEFKKFTLRNPDTPVTGYAMMGLNPNGSAARIPGDAYLKLQNSGTGFYNQTGNVSSTGFANFSGQVTSFSNAVRGGGIGAVSGGTFTYMGIQSGLGFLEAFNGASQIGMQINPLLANVSIGNAMNLRALAVTLAARIQLYGGTYAETFLAIDSGNIGSLKPYMITTNGDNLFWSSKVGTVQYNLTNPVTRAVKDSSTLPANTLYVDRAVAAGLATVGGSAPFSDATAIGKNSSDATKTFGFNLSSITTATKRTWTVPNFNGTFAAVDHSNSWSVPQDFSAVTLTVGTPINGSDAVPKSYVDAIVPVVVISSYTPTLGTNINLTSGSASVSSYSVTNGTGVHSLIWGSLTATAAITVSSQEFNLPVTTTQSAGVVIGTFFWGPAGGAATGVSGLVKVVNSTTARIDFFTGATTTNGNFIVTLDYSH